MAAMSSGAPGPVISISQAALAAAPAPSSAILSAFKGNHRECGVDFLPSDVPGADYGGFFTWPEMAAKMESWLEQYPTLVSCRPLGKTFQGRNIPLLKISNKPTQDEDEPEVLFLVGVHPREQAPTIAIIEFLDEILGKYGKDPAITAMIDGHELWVVPMLNVDGKIWDFLKGNGSDKGADWRKNRHPNTDGTVGVDLNRNFPVRWGGDRTYDPAWKASTATTKGNIYEGPSPASEPEVQAVMEFVRSRPLRVMLDLHSPLHDMRGPGFLSAREQRVYAGLLDQMVQSQQEPYPVQLSKPGGTEPKDEGRGSSNTGVSFPWSYYTTGAYSFNIEIGLRVRYPDPQTAREEYRKNIRGPLLTLIRESGKLQPAGKGSLQLVRSRWDGARAATSSGAGAGAGEGGSAKVKPGATVTWYPQISGNFEYATAVITSPNAVVKREFCLAPATRGFGLQVEETARPGTKIPLALYVWDENRKLSVLKEELVVE